MSLNSGASNNGRLEFNNNLFPRDYTLCIKHLYAFNIKISIKDGSNLYSMNLFSSSLGDLLFHLVPLHSQAQNMRRSWEVALMRRALRQNPVYKLLIRYQSSYKFDLFSYWCVVICHFRSVFGIGVKPKS